MGRQRIERDLRLQPRIGLQKRHRGEPLQVEAASLVLRQQDHGIRRRARTVRAGERHLAADDGLHAAAGAGLAEFERPEQVGRIGDRDRRHRRLLGEGGNLVRLDGALAERIGGMDSEMHEIGVRHGANLPVPGEARPVPYLYRP